MASGAGVSEGGGTGADTAAATTSPAPTVAARPKKNRPGKGRRTRRPQSAPSIEQEGSPPATAETPDDTPATTLPPRPTPVGAPSPALASAASERLHYADFASSRCVEGDSAGRKSYEVGYDTDEECCRSNFLWDSNGPCYGGATVASVGEGEDVTPNTTPGPTDRPTLDPTPDPTGRPIHDPTPPPVGGPSVLFYADWNLSRCEEQPTGTKQPWDIGYATEDECCRNNFLWYQNSICYPGAVVTPEPTKTPTKIPTGASPLPVGTTAYYYPDFDAGRCVPASVQPRLRWGNTYEDEGECCRDNFAWDPKGDCYYGEGSVAVVVAVPEEEDVSVATTPLPTPNPTPLPTPAPSSPPSKRPTPPSSISAAAESPPDAPVAPLVADENNAATERKYYANVSRGRCVARDSRPQSTSRWSRAYDSQEECCRDNFFAQETAGDDEGGCYAGDDAVGVAEEAVSDVGSDAASESGAAATTTESLYYADFDGRECVLRESGRMQRWDAGYATEDECCRSNFGWDEAGDCYAGDAGASGAGVTETTTSTSVPSKTPTKAPSPWPSLHPTTNPSRRPSFPPTKRPSGQPSLRPMTSSPSKNPTKRPTDTPIVRGTPTASPVITQSPTSEPTPSPSAKPTSNSTTTPQLAAALPVPESSSTSLPTSGPTDRRDALLAQFRTVSPLIFASQALDDQRSHQYKAMGWLLDDAEYEAYPLERRVQRYALATTFLSLRGREWESNDGWMTTGAGGDPSDECSWHGVTCDIDYDGSGGGKVVTSIDLGENMLQGNVPAEICLLDKLERLGLTRNFIAGFPSELLSHPRLLSLDMDKNLIREIPTSGDQSDAPKSLLEELYLGYNKITSIPDEFFDRLPNVKHLWISDNRLSSSIPPGLGRLSNGLEELDLSSNYLTGSIPSELHSLAGLRALRLRDNVLTGELSSEFCTSMTNLTVLDLETNYFSGEIPTEIGALGRLEQLHLGDNDIVGQLPWLALSGLSALTTLDLSQNYLNSTVGPEVGSMSNLVSLRLDNNYRLDDDENLISFGIMGPIPGTIGNLHRLQELRMENNFVGGALPPSIGNLRELVTLRIESNNLQSIIPSTIGNMENLQQLHLWSNYLTSTISGELGRLGQLQELFLDDNELTGTVPHELGGLKSATYISFAENHLEGTIPPSFGTLSSLARLDVQFNRLFGEVPPQLANIPLAKLKLEGNYFYGDVPDGICESIQYLSANCASPRRSIGSTMTDSTLLPGILVINESENIPTPSPTYEYWWSCNCCTTCYNDLG